MKQEQRGPAAGEWRGLTPRKLRGPAAGELGGPAPRKPGSWGAKDQLEGGSMMMVRMQMVVNM